MGGNRREVSEVVTTGAWLGAVLGAALGAGFGGALGVTGIGALSIGFGAAVGGFAGAETGTLTALVVAVVGRRQERPWLAAAAGALLPGAAAAAIVPGGGLALRVTAGVLAALLGGAAAVVGWRLTPPPPAQPSNPPPTKPPRHGRSRFGRPGPGATRRERLMWFGAAGAVIAGGAGAVCGVVIAVHVNPLAAPFAAGELGLPCAALGLVAGTVIGLFR